MQFPKTPGFIEL